MTTSVDSRKEREKMIEGLIREGLLRSPSVIEALRKVPRELFLPEHLRPHAYSDVPLPTGYGQTISAPHDSIKCRAIHGRDHE